MKVQDFQTDGTKVFHEIKEIQIAVAFDENYAYPAIVMLTSLFENALDNTKYIVTAMIPSNLSDETKTKVISLNELYQSHEIIFYDMGDAFIQAQCTFYVTTPTYYRLKLPDVLKDQDKCIYIDVDTIVLKDLQELHNIDIENYYIGGACDYARYLQEINQRMLELKNVWGDKYINAGVLLMNLKKMRQDDVYKKFEELILNKGHLLLYNDQDALNSICYEKILTIKPKFNYVFGWQYQGSSNEDKNEAKQNPYIIHYACLKPWIHSNCAISHFWFSYAQKTKFYDEICNKFNLK
ncbi:MAG: glycosyltransferase family 8 protein [Clostridiales bacterium]|jgi:lipopolysaccharide biosynthesis glycosyltransferase|nr:glycosyltransferase family 8 protein [Clostridiales bacterium]